jgi:hypothetical protein
VGTIGPTPVGSDNASDGRNMAVVRREQLFPISPLF